VAVFASRDDRTGTERLVVLAETRHSAARERNRLETAIAQASLALLETPPDDIVLVPPRTVPKTSSGKIRRSAARDLYERGALVEPGREPWLQFARLFFEGTKRRLRRGTARVFELAYAGYWWALLTVLGAIVWPAVVLLPVRSWRHAVLRAAARSFLWLARIPLTMQRESPVPGGGVVIVSNHASYLDGLVLRAALDGELSFVAKQELQHQWIAGPFLRRIDTIFVRRSDPRGGVEDTEAIVRAARNGRRLVAMPEGTFTRMPGLLPFRLGAFLTAVEAGVPVVPVTLRGTRMVLRGDQWFPRRGGIVVHVGEPLLADGKGFSAAVRLRDRCRQLILQQSGEPDLAHERVELPPDR
jgi:1-acyl-sn-glycerol-3-phosphate acyltransferase